MHLAVIFQGMLPKPARLVWALRGGLWGPGLHGTCWGLELWGTRKAAVGRLRALSCRAEKTQNTCLSGGVGGRSSKPLTTPGSPPGLVAPLTSETQAESGASPVSRGRRKWFSLEVTLSGCSDVCSHCFLFLANETVLVCGTLPFTEALQHMGQAWSLENPSPGCVFIYLFF